MRDKPQGKNTTNFVKYTGMGFQMLATIGIFAVVGYKIDQMRNSHSAVFTALLGLLGVLISLYQVVRQLNSQE